MKDKLKEELWVLYEAASSRGDFWTALQILETIEKIYPKRDKDGEPVCA